MLLSRFGASSTPYRHRHIVAGGVIKKALLPRSRDILILTVSEKNTAIRTLTFKTREIPAPSIIGANVVVSRDGLVTLLGGGATCFSMGTFWTPGIYSFRMDSKGIRDSVTHLSTRQPLSQQKVHRTGEGLTDTLSRPPCQITRVKITSQDQFSSILLSKKPVILEGLDIGSCVQKWNLDYLLDAVGTDRKVNTARIFAI
jgi:tRNA wybutosine-synthesizing protein 4